MVILLKELVILPNQEIKIDLCTSSSKKIVEIAGEKCESKVLVVAPLSQLEEVPSTDDLPNIGVVANIRSKYVLSNGSLRINLVGEKRVVVKNYYYNKTSSDILRADTKELVLPKYNKNEEKAVIRKLKSVIKEYIDNNTSVSNSLVSKLDEELSLEVLTDLIAKFLPFDVVKKLEYMQNINAIKRANDLICDIEEELEILRIESRIDDKIRGKLYKEENKYYIREKIERLKEELGEVTNLKEDDVLKFESILSGIAMPSSTKNKFSDDINKYKNMQSESADANVLYNYINFALSLPWNKWSEEFLNSEMIKSYLDSSHFGLDEIKERIYDYVDIKKISGSVKSPVMCIVGPPGIGKTSIAKTIAESLNRKFVKVSVGGLSDSIELTGSRKTYVGACAGKIIQSIKKAGVCNPVILIDEVDKMTKDYKGDPASILLDVLDNKQNKTFVDNYLEEPYDLSNVLFILTANEEFDIPYVLRDRLDIISVDSYTFYEKLDIAGNYLIPKVFENYNIRAFPIKTEVVSYIISKYTEEAGVRELERILTKLIRKMIIKNTKNISVKLLSEYLGDAKYGNSSVPKVPSVGISNAIAYTSSGGSVTSIETIKTKGDGKLVITGNVESTMEESIYVVKSYIRSIKEVDFNKLDVHIHFLEASVSKDGTSAGVSIAVSLLSTLINRKVDNKFAFTGELSLNGKILKVGRAKDKVIAAINSGMKKVYLPKDNESDILSIPIKYLEGIELVYVSDFKEIYSELF